jgi:hypothetical protein
LTFVFVKFTVTVHLVQRKNGQDIMHKNSKF